MIVGEVEGGQAVDVGVPTGQVAMVQGKHL